MKPLSIRRSIAAPLAALLALTLIPAPPVAAADAFGDARIISGLSQPVAMDFLPDGRALVADRAGGLLLGHVTGPTPSVSTYLTVAEVDTAGERGLLDVLVDDLAAEPTVYLYYQHAPTMRSRIARLPFTGNAAADLAAMEVLWISPDTYSSTIHYGGSLNIDNNGLLFLTVGDNANPAAAADLTTISGKVLRFERDGTIPGTNPFAATPGALDEIYAIGLRNPFRATIDRTSGHFYVGDVGFNDVEEVNLVAPAADFGWGRCEGPTGCPAGVTLPVQSYDHNGGTASITMGEVYRDTVFPAGVQGSLVYGDYITGRMWYAPLGAGGSLGPPVEMLTTASSPVWIGTGPDGNIYYIEFGFGGSNIHRVTSASGNQPPRILDATATPDTGTAPLTVDFDASAVDPESLGLTYTWSFGDGTNGVGPNVQHTYSANGAYEAVLTVTDGATAVSSEVLPINVGGVPVAQITSPAAGSTFAVGETASFSGRATDPNQALRAEQLRWTIQIVHDDHVHPVVGPILGSTATFAFPDVTEHTPPYRFRVTFAAEDDDGLTGADSIDIFATPAPGGGLAASTGYDPSAFADLADAAAYLDMDPGHFQLVGVHVAKFLTGISGFATTPQPIPEQWKPDTGGSTQVASVWQADEIEVLEWAMAHYDLDAAQSLSLGASLLTFLAGLDRVQNGR